MARSHKLLEIELELESQASGLDEPRLFRCTGLTLDFGHDRCVAAKVRGSIGTQARLTWQSHTLITHFYE